eukprot:jgi/Tetstr1/465340/TSEL_010026.t1
MASSTTPPVFNLDVIPRVAAPEFNIEETSTSDEISGNLKNEKEENLKLGLTEDRVLTIVGEQSIAVEKKDGTKEEKVLYQRAVPLPPHADEHGISEELTHFMQLKVVMPKRQMQSAPSRAVGAY